MGTTCTKTAGEQLPPCKREPAGEPQGSLSRGSGETVGAPKKIPCFCCVVVQFTVE